ncbi:MAG: hypothetical protein JST10_09240, partial [Bacteroidetes bacterium]|nr:hypothetical protein [Bacteroidota bacterium]
MKKKSFLVIAISISISAYSQQTRFYTDPPLVATFKEAKDYFQKEEYSLAYPLFRELQRSVRETDKVELPVTVQEINYYSIVCALKQNEGRAEQQALDFIDQQKNTART